MGRPATLRVDIVTNSKGADKGIGATESRLGKFGGRAAKVGKLAAKGLAVVGVAAIGVGVSVAKSASRQEQAFGALDSIYGKNSARVKRWAKNASGSVGLAASEYAELSSVVGAQLQGMGFETDKSANKSKQLIGVGADLAATFGGSVSDAVSAVSSLLKGERDPIERYGVSIKQADVNAKLAAMGLDGLTGAAAKQANAQATLALLFDQTKKSTGAFARESNTLAGQQERLKAKFENVKATVGAKLTPVLTRLFSWINNKLFPGAAKLGRELQTRFGPTVQRVGEWVTGRLVPALRDLWTWFMQRIYPSIRSAVIPIFRGVQSAVRSVTSSVHANSGSLSKLVTFIKRVIEASGPLRVLMGKTLGLAFRAAGGFIGGTISAISRLIDVTATAASWIQWLIDKVRALSSMSLGKIGDAIGGLFTGAPVAGMVSPLTRGISDVGMGSRLATAGLNTAAATPSFGSAPATGAAGAVVYVDRRSFPIEVRIEGTPDATTARKLERLLADNAKRMGRRPAFSRGLT